MAENKIDTILDSVLQVLPVIHKKLLKVNPADTAGNLSRPHLVIMGMLAEGSLPISEVARRMVAPRSQMTHLVDYLAARDIVVRVPDSADRRVTNISLTRNGRAVYQECQDLVRQNVRKKLAVLSPGELTDLADALARLSVIGSKLE